MTQMVYAATPLMHNGRCKIYIYLDRFNHCSTRHRYFISGYKTDDTRPDGLCNVKIDQGLIGLEDNSKGVVFSQTICLMAS